ncbi:MAG: hypothetical protein IMF00_02000 [Proteobacteria bacterium]|nr:hypothetical protein [Pseudomonadota bacterium]
MPGSEQNKEKPQTFEPLEYRFHHKISIRAKYVKILPGCLNPAVAH